MNRALLGLLVAALVRIQFLAIRTGSGWKMLAPCLFMFLAGAFVLGSLGRDNLDMIGRCVFFAFILGLLQAKPPARVNRAPEDTPQPEGPA